MDSGTIAATPKTVATMRHQGRLTQWNDDKGFGFVTLNGGGDRAFVHIKAFERAGRRPVEGDLLTYATARDAQGRLQATAIRFASTATRATPAPGGPTFGDRFGHLLVIGFALALAGLIVAGRLPLLIGISYTVLSLVALLAYQHDKRAAVRGDQRTPEDLLRLVALCSGWPGALLAQRWFQHKSKKAAFRQVFWFTVIANVAVLGWYAGR